jgi:hypothetical protein
MADLTVNNTFTQFLPMGRHREAGRVTWTPRRKSTIVGNCEVKRMRSLYVRTVSKVRARNSTYL